MFPDLITNVSDSPANENTGRRQQCEANLWLPLHTLIDNGCDRVRKELETIQASNNTLLLEHNRIAMERDELKKKVHASYEKSCVIFMEMSRQREVANRLESIIDHCSPFLPSEKHREIADSVYHAKQFTSEDLKRLAAQQEGNGLVVIPDDIILNRNSEEQRFAEISSAQTSLTNLVLQLLLVNASNNLNSDDSPRDDNIVQNRLANIVPNSLTWPMIEPKPQAPKRKRLTKCKIQPVKQPLEKPNSELQKFPTQLGKREFKQNKLDQITPKTSLQQDTKPTSFVAGGQENSNINQSSSPKQKTMYDFCTSRKSQ